MEFSGIDDLCQMANRRLPRLFRDYVNGGAHGEVTVRANRQAFLDWKIIPRCLRDVSQVDIGSTWLGRSRGAPFMLGPVGFAGMMHAGGDVMAAQAAARAGIPLAVSTFSIASMEKLSRVPGVDLLAQIYVFRDRDLTRDMLRRAHACGIDGIILTVDTAITPMRARDVRNGFRRMTRPSVAQLLSMAGRPGWSLRMLMAGKARIGNLAPYGMGRNLLEEARNAAAEIDPSLTWQDLAWLRKEWGGRLIVKGVMDAADARQCVDNGADALIVSNHGGRQMDPSPATLSVLPEIVEAVGDRCEVVLDSGVRQGGDIVTALALGASGVALGRPWAWALAAGGRKGMDALTTGLSGEVRDVMGLAGVRNMAELVAQRKQVLRRA
ncbi:L-lactate dehydrogenase [Komagataeibacter europaeus NBRC 3261]|uniref:L-lactate dehydrogenase n=1 Tax=Komagataeibacter europaeus NBRC 3261 TaxID=1234669 RepID=A0A0D6Q5B9_KOMEU|nr:alpha-hydroxy acid oxidase [Komagataeibacter europaeus]GAN97951.1 L-lactate dehydrogenase [Komagataeibacter europaeus NBRC 3261]